MCLDVDIQAGRSASLLLSQLKQRLHLHQSSNISLAIADVSQNFPKDLAGGKYLVLSEDE